jgi:hypothetical protein
MMNLYEWSVIEYLKYRNLYYYRIEELEQFFSNQYDKSVKNFDILVPGNNVHLLIEIKGRKASGKNKLRFENWVSGEDIQSLIHWKQKFGEFFKGIFCFVYKIEPYMPPAKTEFTSYSCNNLRYALFGVDIDKYIAKSTLRSIKWNTFSLSTEVFRKCSKPFEHFLDSKNQELEIREIAKTFEK